jgi:hypothetical protein
MQSEWQEVKKSFELIIMIFELEIRNLRLKTETNLTLSADLC